MKRIVRSDWRTVVLVCGKCTRKLDGGFGEKGRTPLVKALRKWTGKGKGRKASLGAYEVPCLKVCPKRAVTVVNGADPGRWLIVDAGTPVEQVAERLGLLGRTQRPVVPLKSGEGVSEGSLPAPPSGDQPA